jgi:hypothetical protein
MIGTVMLPNTAMHLPKRADRGRALRVPVGPLWQVIARPLDGVLEERRSE